ncbi:MAG: tRNA (adenosine(37)-N6)-dimethylallyltransferase MiaA [Paracoccaceae bacterium]
MLNRLGRIATDRPVLIAGPTACGKSELAMQLAQRDGGVIVNADAMQVYANWRVLSARPTPAQENRQAHRLYGHVPGDVSYSVGQWLRDIAPVLAGPARVIIVGGTGLYFSALTQGLADIPPTPADIRRRAEARLESDGASVLLADLDSETRRRIDTANPVRIQRAWEVLQSTGRGLADWQDRTAPALLAPDTAELVLITADTRRLNQRIRARFDEMLADGALNEARANLAGWSPNHASAKIIGAAQLIAHLQGHIDLDQVRDSVAIATRQYAKRQRSWFRSRMQAWRVVSAH